MRSCLVTGLSGHGISPGRTTPEVWPSVEGNRSDADDAAPRPGGKLGPGDGPPPRFGRRGIHAGQVGGVATDSLGHLKGRGGGLSARLRLAVDGRRRGSGRSRRRSRLGWTSHHDPKLWRRTPVARPSKDHLTAHPFRQGGRPDPLRKGGRQGAGSPGDGPHRVEACVHLETPFVAGSTDSRSQDQKRLGLNGPSGVSDSVRPTAVTTSARAHGSAPHQPVRGTAGGESVRRRP